AVHDDQRLMPIVRRFALAVAVSSALYALALSFAPTATPLAVLVPLPALVLAVHSPGGADFLWLLSSTATVGCLLGWDAAAGFVLPFGLPALALAAGLRRRWSFERTVLAGVVTWSAGILSLLCLSYGTFAGVVAAAREQLAHSVELALTTYGSLGAA